MSTSDHVEALEPPQRRDRAAIAAQACQTCRNRKSKCDEQRPKCGLCRRLNVECQYREAQPTKKDKTMVHILESLHRLEDKFDTLSLNSNVATPATPQGDRQQVPAMLTQKSTTTQSTNLTDTRSEPQSPYPKELQRSLNHLTAAHQVLLWPFVYLTVMNLDPAVAPDLYQLLQGGTPWFIHIELEKHPDPLPCNPVRHSLLVANPRSTSPPQRRSSMSFLGLSVEDVGTYTNAYFNTFNLINPILNRTSFVHDVVEPMLQFGYVDGDASACIGLLVFALGQVAIEGVHGAPISHDDGVPSGIRGGTCDSPPGLGIFNEARRRIGFVLSHCGLENVQIYLLQATYYEASARHMDFWRCSVSASMACQVLIRCEPIDWESPRADLIKKAYWTCVLGEDLYHLELDLPETGIRSLEDQVPLPYFLETHDGLPPAHDARSHFQYHFLAMIALCRLINRIHGSLHGKSKHSESAEDIGGPPVQVVRELIRQLDTWRTLLPPALQWSDGDRFDFPESGPNPEETLFALEQGPVPMNHPFNLDIVTAQLRTRFYYARFLLYRPFVYKALHFREMMNAQDAEYAALCIQSATLWQLALAPPRNKKRLVPHLFTWTQSFLSILVIFRMVAENEYLRSICETKVDRREMQQTAVLLLDWVKDMKKIDGIAEWSWRLLSVLYERSP